MAKKTVTKDEAKKIGDSIGVVWDKVDLEQLRRGMEVEYEHGTVYPSTNVTDDDPVVTAKIALAHIREIPDYYTWLDKMEEEGKKANEKKASDKKEKKEETSEELSDKITKFFKDNPNPSDDMVHGLAQELGIDKHKFEEEIYSLLTELVKDKTINEEGFSKYPQTTSLGISKALTKRLGNILGIDFKKFSLDEFRYGIIDELSLMEVNTMDNITNENLAKAAFRAKENLERNPAHYSENESEKERQFANPLDYASTELRCTIENIVREETEDFLNLATSVAKEKDRIIEKWSPYFEKAGFNFDAHDIDFSDVSAGAIEAMGKALKNYLGE